MCPMSIMFRDIHDNLESTLLQKTSDHLAWSEMIYVEDTMLMRKRARKLNNLLAEIEKESGKYNFKIGL